MWPSHLILLDQGRSVGSGIAVTPLFSRCLPDRTQRFPMEICGRGRSRATA